MIEKIDRDKGRTPSIQEVADKANELIDAVHALAEALDYQNRAILALYQDLFPKEYEQGIDMADIKKKAKEEAN